MGIYDRDYMRNNPNNPDDYEKAKRDAAKKERDELLESETEWRQQKSLKMRWIILGGLLLIVAGILAAFIASSMK